MHLVSGLVGEGDGCDVARLQAAFAHHVGDLLGDHARLAAARAGQDEAGAVEVLHGFALGGVQMGQHRQDRGIRDGRF